MSLICVDVDGMLTSFPDFFRSFFPLMRQGNTVGILTGRPESEKDQLKEQLATLGIQPDFIVCRPLDEQASAGIFKAQVCNEMGVDVLFDDFDHSDPVMVADFFTHNHTTEVFTSWAYHT